MAIFSSGFGGSSFWVQSMKVELGNEPCFGLEESEGPFQNEEISILKRNITLGSKRKRRAITLQPQNKIALPFEKRKN